ncbi:MAG TPA: hypothetical protein VLA34_09335, partial [Candidatus Krumholzibacterium sp.]|nr:hypothetical protein [Candidatus Krumholzibacterium sp.]
MNRADIAIVLVCLFNISVPGAVTADRVGEDGFVESRERFYDIGSLMRIRTESSLTSTAVQTEERRVDDIRLSLSMGRSWMALRYNRREAGERAAFFIDSVIGRCPARLTAGYFVPDLGLGLTYPPVEDDYLSTAGFSVREYRHFVRRTSFYGRSLRGGAVTLAAGFWRLLLFAGQPGQWKDVSFVTGEDRLTGSRLEYAGGAIRAGLTFSRSGEAGCAGFDLLRKGASSTAGLEIAVDEDRQVSFMTGIRNGSGGTSFGLRVYGGRYGRSTMLSRVLSGSPFDRKGVAGLVVYIGRRAGSL